MRASLLVEVKASIAKGEIRGEIGQFIARLLDEREALLEALKRLVLFSDDGFSALVAEARPQLPAVPTQDQANAWFTEQEEKALRAARAAIAKAEAG